VSDWPRLYDWYRDLQNVWHMWPSGTVNDVVARAPGSFPGEPAACKRVFVGEHGGCAIVGAVAIGSSVCVDCDRVRRDTDLAKLAREMASIKLDAASVRASMDWAMAEAACVIRDKAFVASDFHNDLRKPFVDARAKAVAAEEAMKAAARALISSCTTARHEDIKSDPREWVLQRYIGKQASLTEDGAGMKLECRLCASCGTTLALELGAPAPAPAATGTEARS
jgi:hypothetical protein